MIKYSKDGKACYLAGTFNFGGKILARVISVYSDEVKIMPFEKWNSSDFTIADISKAIQKSEVPKPISEQLIEEVSEPTKIIEVINKTVEATTPKGKRLTFDLTEIEDFCKQYKLEIEAVKSVLEGVQKTHRKWGFELVE